MGIWIAGLRPHRTQLLIALAFSAIACCVAIPYTYTVHPENVPLPPGVSSNPTQFRDQFAARQVGPAHQHRRFAKCHDPCLVDVSIAPVGDTREANPAGEASPIAPGSGRPVAKILNLDATLTERMYGFRPSSLFEYYVWADTAALQTRMTLLEVPAPGQSGSVRAFFQKNLHLCNHLHPGAPGSDADFRWCEGVVVSTGITVHQAGILSIEPLTVLLSRVAGLVTAKVSEVERPIWLRCTDGCCG
jgi:hypothetical protein